MLSEKEQFLYTFTSILLGIEGIISSVEGDEFASDERIVLGRKVHLVGETHKSLKPIKYVHDNLVAQIARNPSAWLMLRENARTRTDSGHPDHYYFQELATIFGIPYEDAIPDLFDRGVIDYIQGHANLSEREIIHIFITNVTSSKRNLRLLREDREGLVGILSAVTKKPKEYISGIIDERPTDRLLKDTIMPYWNEYTRQQFHRVLGQYSDKSQVIVSVGIGHLNAFK